MATSLSRCRSVRNVRPIIGLALLAGCAPVRLYAERVVVLSPRTTVEHLDRAGSVWTAQDNRVTYEAKCEHE